MSRQLTAGILKKMSRVEAAGGIETDTVINGISYRIHAFTSVGNDTITFSKAGKVDVLVVAGGAGGGSRLQACGGGGAGGVVFIQNYEVPTGDISIIVGSGGAGASEEFFFQGDDGEDSFFGSLNAKGGGGGGRHGATGFEGRDGGSGGGAAGRDSASPAGTGIQPSQPGDSGTYGFGNDGGVGHENSSTRAGGGGGGAGGQGQAAASDAGGAGGLGKDLSEIFGSAYGNSGVFATGGKGGDINTPTSTPFGADNTGDGGGGAGGSTNTAGGAGGSGIVLIRYRRILSHSPPAEPYCPPYQIPEIPTAEDYSNIVYIDPGAPAGGNGTIENPFNTLNGITIVPNTAYLLKAGTILNERINKVWNNVLVGSYGVGEKPIIYGGLVVGNDSQNSIFRELDIRTDTSIAQEVVNFLRDQQSNNITIAFCKITGFNTGSGYPQYAIRHGSHDLVFFNNEVSHSDNNLWWIGTYDNVKIIRNWMYKANIGGETSTDSSGDIIQAIYRNDNLYIAGNIMDRSNSTWKYALMLRKMPARASQNIIVEYNTFIDTKPGAGGAVVYWIPGGDGDTIYENNILRKNVIQCVEHNGITLRNGNAIQSYIGEFNLPSPYGIRDNHIIHSGADLVWPTSLSSELDASNLIFADNTEYSVFLSENPEIGLYGSDIAIENF